MNRIILMVTGMFGASSLLLVDSAIKGTALLLLAAIAAILLRRDSAATRHLLWMLAIVAMLVVPVLSAMLPQWRVLPEWAGVPPKTTVAATSPPSIAMPAESAVEITRMANPVKVELPSATAHQSAAELPVSPPALVTPKIISAPSVRSWNWIEALPLAWAIGFSVLILRLLAARLLLWNSECRGTVIGSSTRTAKPTDDAIVTNLQAACLQLGIARRVTLLMHPDKTIPVVWGIFRCRLLLPESARHWSGEQLRSVLLHELAHVKRRDTVAQMLAQIAVALHWFNPLVWLAVWRLGVERERACDDLVLASGVRPSAYAGHLLEVVTALSPVRWSQSCGLAMARKSSLEGRLLAVLSKNQSRRRVSVALAAIAFAMAVGIAVPVAMLRAADEKPAEKPKPTATNMTPKHQSAQALFKKWQDSARTDGKIPGGALRSLARAVAKFIKLNPTDERVPKLTDLLERIDTSHDWTQADAVALLNDLTDIYPTLPEWAGTGERFSVGSPIRPGEPLPAELSGAAWGQPAANGLRVAWLLEPGTAQHPLGTNLKSRILFHNTGKEAVVFQTPDWHQYSTHKARDAKGAAIIVSATYWTRLSTLVPIRLAPGEYAEAEAHGIAIGARNTAEENWAGLRIGAWIEAKEGDEVTFLPAAVTASGDLFTMPPDRKTAAESWKAIVRERIDREGPMPAAAADREQLIRRVMPDLIGLPPTREEIAAFAADNSPDALAALVERIVPRIAPFAGDLPAGEIKFRVTAADPDAAKKPRVANEPGWYTIGDHVALSIVQKPDGDRRVNEASILFFSTDPYAQPPGKSHEIKLPDGHLPWAAAWERGSTVLWVAQKGLVRKYDFRNPAQVKETRFDPGSIVDVPEQLRDSLRKVFEAPGAPVQQREPLKPKDGAKLEPGMEQNLKWGEPVKGLRAAVVIRHSTDKPKAGDFPDLYLVVQNVSKAPIRLTDADVPANVSVRSLLHKNDGRILYIMGAREPALGDVTLQPREVTFLPMFDPVTKMTAPADPTVDKHTLGQTIAEGVLKNTHESLVIQMQIDNAPAGAWAGKLVSGDTSGSVAAGQPQPKDENAKALYKVWQHNARKNGNIPGGFIGRLSAKVNEFIRVDSADAAGAPYAKKMEPLVPRFDAARDWTLAQAVALLDDIAAVSSAPLSTALDEAQGVTLKPGSPLPKELANAPWGQPLPNGLRMAWLLEPRAAEHRLGTPLKSRILLHNSGNNIVVFRARTWHQGVYKARDAQGADINVEAVTMFTRPPLVPFRLWPGEFVELNAPGIGVGPMGKSDDWQNISVGSWIEAKAGDDVTVTTGPVPLSDWNEEPPKGEPRWWLDLITARLARELPLPADAAERAHLVYRAGMDLFGTPLSAQEIAAFVSDAAPTALDSLAKRLSQHADFKPYGFTRYVGSLTSAPTKFRVLPPDPDDAKKPRTATDPGEYTLGANAALVVTRRPVGERIVNEAHIAFGTLEQIIPKSYEIKLPDGYGTWAAAWMRGGTVLWVLQKGNVRSYDYTDPAQVKETTLEEPANVDKVPKPILDALRAAVDVPGAPKPAPAASKKETQR